MPQIWRKNLGRHHAHSQNKGSLTGFSHEGRCLFFHQRNHVRSFVEKVFSSANSLPRQNSTEPQREDHEDDIISIVRAALVDDEANVRSAAAQAFDVLQDEMGTKAIDQTIPTLLEALRQPGKGSGTALQALKEVMNVSSSSSQTVFNSLYCSLGSSFDSFPSVNSHPDRDAYVCLQCSRLGFPRHRRWKFLE